MMDNLNKKIHEKDEIDDLGKNDSIHPVSLGHDHDLYRDEDNIKHKVVSVKRINFPRKGENWNILEDGKVMLSLSGTRFTNSEKEFLRTIKGVNFLISGWKAGFKSVLKFKNAMKKELNG
jgi:hypothetical protein